MTNRWWVAIYSPVVRCTLEKGPNQDNVPTWLKIIDWAVNNGDHTTVASLNAIHRWESSHSIIIINAPVYQRI